MKVFGFIIWNHVVHGFAVLGLFSKFQVGIENEETHKPLFFWEFGLN